MAYTYGSEVTSVSSWSGKLRVGIEVTKVSETSKKISYRISVIPQLYNYHGFPHHYFNVNVDGSRVKNQSDVFIANSPSYPGNGIWYTSNSDISAYSNTVEFDKGSAQRTVSVVAHLGVNYGYTEPTNNVWVAAVDASHSVNITIPKRDSTVHVKVNGAWKDATAYVKVNGEWKEAIPYVKVNGTWKEGV